MIKKKVVHLGLTPVAGAPIQIVKALNSFSNFEARFINFSPKAYGDRIFEEDLDFNENTSESLKIVNSADIIHLHQSIELENNSFKINFLELLNKGKHILRHWHSEPTHFKKVNFLGPEDFQNEKIPHLVVGQYHERYYKNALIVPNIIFSNEFYKNVEINPKVKNYDIVYSPSNKFPINLSNRWATKGFDEISKILNEISVTFGYSYKILTDVDHKSVMNYKQNAKIIIDDVCTGSFHMSGLEGISLGKPTFAYLDSRSVANFVTLTQSKEIPFINVKIDNLFNTIHRVLSDPFLLDSLTNFTKDWYRTFYSPNIMVQHYTKIYNSLINNKLDCKNENLINQKAHEFLNIELNDQSFIKQFNLN